MRRTIFRTPSSAEHVQVCELDVIEMARQIAVLAVYSYWVCILGQDVK